MKPLSKLLNYPGTQTVKRSTVTLGTLTAALVGTTTVPLEDEASRRFFSTTTATTPPQGFDTFSLRGVDYSELNIALLRPPPLNS